jgi:hypothetical protein
MSGLLRALDALWAVMHSAYIEAHRSGENPDVAALEAIFGFSRWGPVGATPTVRTEPDDVLRERQAMTVAGWVAVDPAQAARAGFTDLMGLTKYDEEVGRRLQKRVMRDYPELAERCAQYVRYAAGA